MGHWLRSTGSASVALLAVVGVGCASPVARSVQPRASPVEGVVAPPRRDLRLAELGGRPRRVTDAGLVGPGTDAEVAPATRQDFVVPRDAMRLPTGAKKITVPPGRSFVIIEVPSGELVSIGVFGPREALLAFDLLGLPVPRTLDEDGLLPRVASFRTPASLTEVAAVVDVSAPVELARVTASPIDLAVDRRKGVRLVRPESQGGEARPRPLTIIQPLIGLPTPLAGDASYLLQSPARYQFLRVDVAAALIGALRETHYRFGGDPIAIADISQWDGVRPATDIGRPRHISHEGGRDVDMALPALDGPSTVRTHCSGVLVESDVQGCAPGTAKGVDATRLAYLLGLLVETSPGLERIYTDDVYVREIRRALERLHERRWIHDAGYEALLDDALLRASPWHTDHIHLRFAGKPGRVLW